MPNDLRKMSIGSFLYKSVPPWKELAGMIIGAVIVIMLVAAFVARGEPSATPYPTPVVPVPVSVTIPQTIWVAWILLIGSLILASGLILRFIIKASKLIHDVNEYGSVVIDIAKQFKSDSGSTLKDAINRIEQSTMEAKVTAQLAKVMIENLTSLMTAREGE